MRHLTVAKVLLDCGPARHLQGMNWRRSRRLCAATQSTVESPRHSLGWTFQELVLKATKTSLRVPVVEIAFFGRVGCTPSFGTG